MIAVIRRPAFAGRLSLFSISPPAGGLSPKSPTGIPWRNHAETLCYLITMKSSHCVLISVLTLAVVISATTAALPAFAGDGGKPIVFVSIAPQRLMVERIAGKRVTVDVFIPPGSDPHHFEPRPRQISRLAEARLYLAAGLALERRWLSAAAQYNRKLRVVDISAGLDRGDSNEPHLWLNPRHYEVMAANALEAMAAEKLAPEDALRNGFQSLARDLRALDEAIRARLSDLPDRHFLVQHPAWGHFAAAYDLVQISIEPPSGEPTPRELAATIERARALGLRTVFAQPGSNLRAARTVARALGAEIIFIDPLAGDYLYNLRHTAELIATSLESK